MTSAPTGPERIRLGPRQLLTVRSSTPEVLELEGEWAPGTPPPTHWHPHQHEHFEVLDGELTIVLAGHQRVLRAGEQLDVPPRTAHRMWNAGPDTCRATWVITPAQRTAEMFRFLAGNPGPLSRASMLWRFRSELRLGSPRR